MTGVFKSVLDVIQSKKSDAVEMNKLQDDLKRRDFSKTDPQLVMFVKDESEKFFY